MIDALELTALPASAQALRPAVREFLAQELAGRAPEVLARSWSAFDRGFSQRMAARGWVGLTLPVAYGGAGKSAFDRFVLVEEMLAAGAPVFAHWVADRQSGPLILKYGSEAQRRFYLPRICRAEAAFCIGMSEPQSGSDLASIRTRATPQPGGGWLLSGQKVWTTYAHRCDYMIALVRTSGSAADRHGGLSQLLIDLRLPGITIRPIPDLAGDSHFNEVFFDNVALGADALVGEEGAGWDQVTAELAFERSGPERLYASIVLFDTWLAYLRVHHAAQPWAQRLVGRVVAQLGVLRAMSIAVTRLIVEGHSPGTVAALVKDLGTTLEQDIPNQIAEALGEQPGQPLPEPLLRTLAYTLQVCPTFSLRGGTREILRGMIARGLGLR